MRPLLEGTLYKTHASPKLGSKGANRFCQCDDYKSELVYYASLRAYDADRPSRTVPLASIGAVECIPDSPCSFRIVHCEGSTLTFRAESPAVASAWVDGLRARIGEMGRRSPTMPTGGLTLIHSGGSGSATLAGGMQTTSFVQHDPSAQEIEERVDDFFARRRQRHAHPPRDSHDGTVASYSLPPAAAEAPSPAPQAFEGGSSAPCVS